MIKKAIILLEGRLTNVKELPIHAYYLFEEPNMESEEATTMQAAFDPQTQGQVALSSPFSPSADSVPLCHADLVLSSVHKALSDLPHPWDENLDLSKVLHGTRKEIEAHTKPFMKTLRHALTGYKDGPSIPDIIRVLGPERALPRLEKQLSTYTSRV
jgi:glutamyl-tRNA synthetase